MTLDDLVHRVTTAKGVLELEPKSGWPTDIVRALGKAQRAVSRLDDVLQSWPLPPGSS